MIQLTQAEAIAIEKSGAWKEWTDEEIVKFQLFQKRLCVPFARFHQAIEKVLRRPVWTHEFAHADLLIAEYNKERPTPTFDDILGLIPKDKLIIVAGRAKGAR